MSRPAGMAGVYAMLAVVGAAVPLAAFLPWLGEHGPDLPLLARQLFANRISSFFGLDVIVSAVVLLVLIATEARRGAVRWPWLPVAATLLVGVSCGLPLFLALREVARRSR